MAKRSGSAKIKPKAPEDVDGQSHKVSHTPGALEWLSRHNGKGEGAFLSDGEVAAGKRFQRDFYLAGMEARVTMVWDGLPANKNRRASGSGLSDAKLDARDRLNRACKAIGPELANFVLDALGFEMGLSALEQRYNWPARSGKVALKVALQVLAAFYLSEHAR